MKWLAKEPPKPPARWICHRCVIVHFGERHGLTWQFEHCEACGSNDRVCTKLGALGELKNLDLKAQNK